MPNSQWEHLALVSTLSELEVCAMLVYLTLPFENTAPVNGKSTVPPTDEQLCCGSQHYKKINLHPDAPIPNYQFLLPAFIPRATLPQ